MLMVVVVVGVVGGDVEEEERAEDNFNGLGNDPGDRKDEYEDINVKWRKE